MPDKLSKFEADCLRARRLGGRYRKLMAAMSIAFFSLSSLPLIGPSALAGESKTASTKSQQLIFSLSQQQQNSEILKVWGVPACVLMRGEKPRGLYITGFTGSGLGNELGLEVGDVLLSLNGHVLIDAKQADNLLAHTKSGQLKAVIARSSAGAGGITLLSPTVNYVCSAINQSYISAGNGGYSSASGSSSSSKKEEVDQASIVALEDYMLALVNQDRAQNGSLPPLSKSTKLGALARSYAEDMKKRNYFGHTDPEGLDPVGRARKVGITASIWENLANESGARNLKVLVQKGEQQMMDEPRDNPVNHRGCILNKNHRCVGIGIAAGPSRVICVQEFSRDDVP